LIDWLATGLTAIALVCSAVLLLFIAVELSMVVRHLRLRRRGLARERALLSQPLPPDHALPHVVVQITVCNEGALVERAITSAAALDWPRDKLHTQICDDSDDATTELACAAVMPLAASGLDIAVLRRRDRTDFKAGNLREAMNQTPHEFFAIFDVDYVPPADFLRRAMVPLIADPALGFVQARWDFLNAGENALTRAQAIALDAHHGIEQATRSWAGHPFTFNGTCGIWRRAAIEAGGGWCGDTLAEDLDLSYRAWVKGWRGMFLTSVAVPGELPADRAAWVRQQNRWTTGFGQVARTMIPMVLRDPRLSAGARFAALLHLATAWWGAPITFVMLAAMAAAALLKPALLPLFGTVLAGLIVCAHAVLFSTYRIGNRFVRGRAVPLGRFTADFFYSFYLGIYLAFANALAYWRAMSGRRSAFERTPKRGSIRIGS
jgi:cellulose synthase/poly-beta-1,6-N-acetylglucosamine synthase-like glycosyltransferase